MKNNNFGERFFPASVSILRNKHFRRFFRVLAVHMQKLGRERRKTYKTSDKRLIRRLSVPLRLYCYRLISLDAFQSRKLILLHCSLRPPGSSALRWEIFKLNPEYEGFDFWVEVF